MAKIILECCQNHNGDQAVLKDMIHAAAATGADYCKMQSINSSDLAKRERFEKGKEENGVTTVIKRPYQNEYDHLKALDLSREDEIWFMDECKKAGITPLTTIFTHGSIKKTAELGWEAVKVAGYDCANHPFLRHLSRYFDKMIISTGACHDGEIVKAAELLKYVNTTFLHCVSIYPTPFEEMHLARMQWIKEVTGSCGFSDHSLVSRDGILGSQASIAMGVEMVERHFTVLKPEESRDGHVSINQAEATALVASARKDPADLAKELDEIWRPDWRDLVTGTPHRELSHSEKLNRDYYSGRFTTHLGDGQVDNWEEWTEEHEAALHG